jgi:hypothetical protein
LTQYESRLKALSAPWGKVLAVCKISIGHGDRRQMTDSPEPAAFLAAWEPDPVGIKQKTSKGAGMAQTLRV